SGGYNTHVFTLEKGGPLFWSSSNADQLSHGILFFSAIGKMKPGVVTVGMLNKVLRTDPLLMMFDNPAMFVAVPIDEHLTVGARMGADIGRMLEREDNKKGLTYGDLPNFPGFFPFYYPVSEIYTPTAKWLPLWMKRLEEHWHVAEAERLLI